MNRFLEMARRSAVVTALLALALGPFAAAPAAAGVGPNASSCTVSRSISTWAVDAQGRSTFRWEEQGTEWVWVPTGEPAVALGFQADLTVTNTGAPLNGWTVAWGGPPETTVRTAYNAEVMSWKPEFRDDTVFLAIPSPWNSVLRTGGYLGFGFVGAVSDMTTPPSEIVKSLQLNGRLCTVLR